jgi:glucose/arabinose dehydrogenase
MWNSMNTLVASALIAAAPALLSAQDAPAQPGGKIPGITAVQLVKVAEGFVDPMRVVSPRDGSGRLFVVERHGVVKLVKPDGSVAKKPFLDIRSEVVSSFLEQGLYDLCFHPEFKRNGKFYVHYSDMIRNGAGMIVEFVVSKDDPDKADRDSARPIYSMTRPWANHNGGEIEFGPDGFLYIGSGDGGWEGDPLNAGQDLSNVFGKILRIDVNGTLKNPYRIPESNPFVQPDRMIKFFGVSEEEFASLVPTAKREIWAYGLRNPWTFNFDPKTGDLYIADIGQNFWELVLFQPASSKGGENYGWKLRAGSHPFPASNPVVPKIGVFPVAEYSHEKDGNCVIGLGVYRGAESAMDGVYFVGDWGSGKLWGLKRDSSGKWQFQELLDTQLRFTGGGVGEDGTVYAAVCNCNYGGPIDPTTSPPGAIWKLVPASKVPAGAATAPLDEK